MAGIVEGIIVDGVPIVCEMYSLLHCRLNMLPPGTVHGVWMGRGA